MNTGILAREKPKKSNEWYTPAKYIEAARLVMGGIDLDPASCALANETVKAARYFDEATNGLDQQWYGRVWLNPPFSDLRSATGITGNRPGLIKYFVEKLLSEYRAGNVREAILLVNCDTDAGWFTALWEFLICFADHKVRFERPGRGKESHYFGSTFTYLGPNETQFIRAFQQFGTIARRVAPTS